MFFTQLMARSTAECSNQTYKLITGFTGVNATCTCKLYKINNYVINLSDSLQIKHDRY